MTLNYSDQVQHLGRILSHNLSDTADILTLSILVVRIALLGYSKIHEKAYKCIVCEFGGFQNVLRDACVCAIPT